MAEPGKLKRFLDRSLWPMLIFGAFTALFAFTAAVVQLAHTDNSQLVSKNYYQEGYNLREIVDTERATAATGWTVEVVPLSIEQSGDLMLQLNVTERDGRPADSISGECALYRPSDPSLDVPPMLLTFIGAGRYLRTLPHKLERGAWEAHANLKRGESRYQNRISFFVK